MSVPQLITIAVIIFITGLVVNWKDLGGEHGTNKAGGFILLVVVSALGALLANGISLISTL